MTLDEFNELTIGECKRQLMSVCHSSRWVQLMLDARPFADVETVLKTAAEYWQKMTEEDILEAFSGHAKIGDLSALRDKYSAASAEQGQVAEAQEEILEDLMRMNQEYESKNGFIFIVCATGKSAEQMRNLMFERIDNSRESELVAGALEQAKITELRLNKIFASA